jgi:hypothetical protein
MKAAQTGLGKLLFQDRSIGRAILSAIREHNSKIYVKGELEIGTPLNLENYLANHKSWNYIKECYSKSGKPDGPYIFYKNYGEMKKRSASQ